MTNTGESLLTKPVKVVEQLKAAKGALPFYGATNLEHVDVDVSFSRDDAPALFVPWCFFVMCLTLIALMQDALLSYIVIGTCAITSIFFMALSIGSGWRILASVCFVTSVLGYGLGWVARLFFEFNIALLYVAVLVVAWTLLPLYLMMFLRRMQHPLTGQKTGPAWNARTFETMRGCVADDQMSARVRQTLEQRLVRGDLHWTGEVIQDYVFHVSNTHTFIGIFFCHREHPYEWWERLIIATCVCLLIVFPVAAFDQVDKEHHLDPMLRWLLILAVATIPRNIIKGYFLHMNQVMAQLQIDKGVDEDLTRLYFHEEEEDGEHHEVDPDIEKAVVWEWVTIVFTILFTASIVVVSIFYIKQHKFGDPMYEILARNTDGLGFAFVLELTLDLVVPRRVGNVEKEWCFGFFQAWYRERENFKKESRRLLRDFQLKERLKKLATETQDTINNRLGSKMACC
jgi:hypothetical protein